MKNIDGITQTKNRSKRTLLIFILLFFLILSAILLHLKIAGIQSSDGVRINLAGRQRMLIQKLTKEILLYSNDTFKKSDLFRTIKLFDLTLYSLTDGGMAPSDLNFNQEVQLPEMGNQSTKIQLQKVITFWKPLKSNITKYIGNKDLEALSYIINNNMNVLNEMDKAVSMMQHNAEANNREINILLYITHFSVLMVFGYFLIIKLRQLKQASDYIAHLENILPICSNCKKIREPDSQPENQESWTVIEKYIESRSESKFTHSMCPSCVTELYGDKKWFKKEHKNK